MGTMTVQVVCGDSTRIVPIEVVRPNQITGWWSTDEDGQNKITDGEVHDILYYHVEVPQGFTDRNIRLKLFRESIEGRVRRQVRNSFMGITRTLSIRNGRGHIKVDFVTLLESRHRRDRNPTLTTWSNSANGFIQLFWQVEYSSGIRRLNAVNAQLRVFADEYVNAILKNEIRYTCNAGWIDKTHLYPGTNRDRPDIGARNLWQQFLDENGLRSRAVNGFRVVYTQDVRITRNTIATVVRRAYMVRFGLDILVRKRVAMAIFREVSWIFEHRQRFGAIIGRGGSSFEPADLISNLLGLYSVFRNETEEQILERCGELGARESLRIYRRFPGTFTEERYKNREWTPRFFENDECTHTPRCKQEFPKEFQEVEPHPQDNSVFRRWSSVDNPMPDIPPLSPPIIV